MKVKEADEKYKQRKLLKQRNHEDVRKSKDMEHKITSVQNNIDILMKNRMYLFRKTFCHGS